MDSRSYAAAGVDIDLLRFLKYPSLDSDLHAYYVDALQGFYKRIHQGVKGLLDRFR